MPTRKILVLFAHPVFERSRANRALIQAIRPLASVTVHDLYEAYPAHKIDVRREQALLLDHDVIVFQHPFYWYSTPSLLKEWQDLVLEFQWAYGEKGKALAGKITFNVVTTGGPAQSYQKNGTNKFTMRQFLAPYEQTANLCRMRYLPPFVVHSALRFKNDQDMAIHVQAYQTLINALAEDRVDLDCGNRVDVLEAPFDAVLKPANGGESK